MESFTSTEMQGKKVRDVYVKVYDTRETTFSDQKGKFPTRSKRGNKYIMVMVEVDINAILVEPLKSRKATILWLSGRAGAKRSRGPGFETALVALKRSRTTRV